MESGDHEPGVDTSVDPSTSSVNNLILDYYKKFGRKRDLEQFFSLSTAQTEIRDPTGTFWRKMKSQNDSSDSGEKKSESSAELCRISIQCSIPEPSNSQHGDSVKHQNSDSESPPIVTDEVASRICGNSDEESVKSDDVQSQRSTEAALDTSLNKPHSPTSSITSQRKLEWDSLADVGYANEGDRKTSASSLSTLERLALNQHYSNNDSKLNMKIGPPTSHSTPVEEVDTKLKAKKGVTKKTTKIYQKDFDCVELNMPHTSQTNLPQAISVNLSKHICFNVEKDGGINIDNIKKDISVSPEKNTESSKQVQERLDKEIQTSLLLKKDQKTSKKNCPTYSSLNTQKFPVLISLNSLKKRNRKRKFRLAKKKYRNKNRSKVETENIPKYKTVEQVSEAESFEYMPGHIYNQNRLKTNQSRGTHVGNRSSLESSAGLSTDSSKGSKHSFSKDLEKSIDLLKTVLQQNNNDSSLKKKLIKEVVQRLIKSKYRDDESSTDFLSGLSFNSKILGQGNHTTTSTSDANISEDKINKTRPKKSILQNAKFNSNALASNSQSAPNLPSVSYSEKPNTDLDNMTMKSSDEFYKKYLEALKREQAHKKHLKDKENFLKQKFISSETAINQLGQVDLTTQSKLKSLIKDLTRNNYNDGSGDASNLEGHSNTNIYMDPHVLMNDQRSHSVFTLSSGHTDCQNKNPKLKNIIKTAIHGSSRPGCSKNEQHYCCCPHHTDRAKVGFTDSSVQVNIECNKPTKRMETGNELRTNMQCTKCQKESPRNIAKVVSDSETGDLKYICVCSDETKSEKVTQNYLVYKCSRLVNKSVQLGDSLTRSSNTEHDQIEEKYPCCDQKYKKAKATIKKDVSSINVPQHSKSSQTDLHVNLMVQRNSSVQSTSSQFSDSTIEANVVEFDNDCRKLCIQEAIRSIQTDISINPRLSDPRLSDINIIDDNECVKLVKEHYKEISKSNSENNTEAHGNRKKTQVMSSNSSGKVMSKASSENIHHPKNSSDYAYIAQSDKEVQSDLGLVNNNQNENFDQFTIPIQGTNMTLKVNLGTAAIDNNKINNIAINSQGVATEKTDMTEHYTSLREDCTKSVQCCNANLFKQIKCDGTEKNVPDKSSIKESNTYAVNTCVLDKNKCNTYPKNDQGFARKPLLRTNTDISKFKNLTSLQFDLKNVPTNKQECCDDNYEISTDQPSTRSNESEPRGISYSKSLIVPPTEQKYQTTSDKCANCTDKKVTVNKATKTTITNSNQSGKCTACSNKNVLTDLPITFHNQNQPEKSTPSNQKVSTDQLQAPYKDDLPEKCMTCANKLLTDQPKVPYTQYQPQKCTACSSSKVLEDRPIKANNKNQPEKCTACSSATVLDDQSTKLNNRNQPEQFTACSNSKALVNQPLKNNDQNKSDRCTACSNTKPLVDQPLKNNKNETEKCTACSNSKPLLDEPSKNNDQNKTETCAVCSNPKTLVDQSLKNNNRSKTEKCTACSNPDTLLDQLSKNNNQNKNEKCIGCAKQKPLAEQPMKPMNQNNHEKCTACSKKGGITGQSSIQDNENQLKNTNIFKYCKSDEPQINHDQNSSKDSPSCSKQTSQQTNESKQKLSKKCINCSDHKELSTKPNQHQSEMFLSCSSKSEASKSVSRKEKSRTQSKTSASESDSHFDYDANPDPLLDMIEGITKRYTKKDIEKSKKKKCFKEIMNILNYLLDTEESTDDQNKKSSDNGCCSSDQKQEEIQEKRSSETECCPSKTFVDKGVQLCAQSRVNKCRNSDSSEIAVTSEFPATSSDSATCKLLTKIKKECEKYHQRRCKSHNGLKACETSSTTSVSCEQCKRVHHCSCLRHKCKTHKTKTCGEKPKKRCIAYNLILQTSDSMASEETMPACNQPLKSIIVKVPSKRKEADNIPFKEMAAKLERSLPNCSPRSTCKGHRSRSWPNESEMSSTEEYLRNPQTCTVREYLERNRPDFVEQCSKRQKCLKTINETRPKMCPSQYFKMVVVHTPKCVAGSCLDPCSMCYGGVPMSCNQCVDPYAHIQNEVTRIAQERISKRKLLSLQLAKQQTLSALTDDELRHFAKQLSEDLRRKKVAPKFISEREMKKHSEKIYKSLPEVTRKKEELKKENIKKTNLLMANIFKKNLQKKTLRGSVNLSNYSTVIKI